MSEWETVSTRKHQFTARRRVPGGWLYREITEYGGSAAVALAFVPESPVVQQQRPLDPGNERRIGLLRKYLLKGDLLTHVRCMGFIEEHVFTKWDGHWMCGLPTTTTKHYSNYSSGVTDIGPRNVTHVNRCPIDDSFWYNDRKKADDQVN